MPLKNKEIELRHIESIVILGDSLSDADNVNQERILGFIPMGAIAGLGKAPRGNFTNGIVWNQALGASYANRYMISEIKKGYGWDNSDFSDAIIAKEHHIPDKMRKSYSFDKPGIVSLKPISLRKVKTNYSNAADLADDIIAGRASKLAERYSVKQEKDLLVSKKGKKSVKRLRFSAKPVDLVRNFALGGATAQDYKWAWSFNPKLFFTRLFVSNLDAERRQLFEYDKEKGHTAVDLSKVLALDWIGANDLITVNSKPNFDIVDKAVAARLKNMEALLQKGYLNFISINLPDLSRTPRYQNMTGEKGVQERKNVQDCCLRFNKKLADGIASLKAKYTQASMDIVDAYTIFNKIYKKPEAYGFDADKLKTPFTTSKDFNLDSQKKISPASRYMFWDDLHPSMDMHEILQTFLSKKIDSIYQFKVNFNETTTDAPLVASKREFRSSTAEVLTASPKEKLLKIFIERYKQQLEKDGFFSRSNLDYNNPSLSLFDILKHGVLRGPNRTTQVLKSLNWINDKNEVNLTIYGLAEAAHQLQQITPERLRPGLKDEASLRDYFMGLYKHRLAEDKNGWFGFFRSGSLPANATLAEILNHGLSANNRTREIMQKIGWIDSDGKLNSQIEAFKKEIGQMPMGGV